ncbi:kinase-like domain-containing protein [Schizophyllum commune]
MAPKQQCAKYEYVVTPTGSKILPVEEPTEPHSKDEESPADYNSGGYLQVQVNDTFKNGRYRVVRKLGWGHFSTVWLVKDTQTKCHSALKVVKSAGRYAETARDEIKLLSRVASVSPSHPGREHIVSFLDSFTHQGPEASHICIVFEPLGENLLALIERNKKKGVPRALVKIIARQALLGLQYLHDECDLVHTDIKPENILISIPDVEAHIQSELCQSPTPTSRRVGVPHPTKSRAGVTIPTAQRPRRQVQIFDSQPLSSPRSPSVGFGFNSSSSSLSSGFKSRLHSGVPSASSSYGASIPKVPSGLSMSAPKKEKDVVKKLTAQAPKPVSPSASSSSSSASSISASTGESRSTFSTPPTTNAASSPSSLPTPTATSPELTGPTTSPTGRPQSPTPTKPGAQKIPTRPSLETELEQVEEFCGPPISIKIADLGNATPSKKHYTEDIQTRQYRAPEAIVGRKDWDTRADIWSIACVVFELLTAEYLFDPQSQGELFTKDDDHMAQIIELLGDFELEAKIGGKYSRDLFDHSGHLRYIKTLKPWPLKSVMMQKYLYSEADADALCDFLLPMLAPDFHKRARASDMIDHPWLTVTPADEVVGEW